MQESFNTHIYYLFFNFKTTLKIQHAHTDSKGNFVPKKQVFNTGFKYVFYINTNQTHLLYGKLNQNAFKAKKSPHTTLIFNLK